MASEKTWTTIAEHADIEARPTMESLAHVPSVASHQLITSDVQASLYRAYVHVCKDFGGAEPKPEEPPIANAPARPRTLIAKLASFNRKSEAPNVIPIPRPKKRLLTMFGRALASGYVVRYAFLSFLCLLSYGAFAAAPFRLGLAVIFLLLVLAHAFYNLVSIRRHESESKVDVDWATITQLHSLVAPLATVARGKEFVPVKPCDLTNGQTVRVGAGELVPADLRIVEISDHLDTDTASFAPNLNAKSQLVVGALLLAGSRIIEGSVTGTVARVGSETMLARSITEMTGWKPRRLSKISAEIHQASLIMAVISFGIMIFYLIFWAAYLVPDHEGFHDSATALDICVAILVAFTMIKLPFLYAISKRLINHRMSKIGVMSPGGATSIESLGRMNALVMDMSGYITQERLHVVNTSVDDNWMDTRSAFEAYGGDKRGFRQFLAVASLCNQAQFTVDSLYLPVQQRNVAGNSIDAALIRYVEEFEPVEEIRSSGYKQLHPVTFDAQNKWMHAIFSPSYPKSSPFGFDATDEIMVVKGPPDVLLPRCTEIVGMDGEHRFITVEDRESLRDFNNSWSTEGQRVIMLCVRRVPEAEIPSGGWIGITNWSVWFQGLCVVGLVGLTDPPRPNFRSTVEQMCDTGIQPIMVTGDARETALAIGQQSGLLSDQPDTAAAPTLAVSRGKCILLPGSSVSQWSVEDWRGLVVYERVGFYQVTPEIKRQIVNGLQRIGRTVGATGAKTSDRAVLCQADVGIAHVKDDLTNELSADFYLNSKDVSSLITGKRASVRMRGNLRKAICFSLPAGFIAQIVPILFHFLVGIPLPISTFFMIAIGLVMDMFPTLALLMDDVDGIKPIPERVIDWRVFIHGGLLIGLFETFYAHCMYFLFMRWYGRLREVDLLAAFEMYRAGYLGRPAQRLDDYTYNAQSVYFVTLVMMQAFGYAYASRAHYSGSMTLWIRTWDWRLPLASILSLIAALIVVYLPFFNSTFNTRTVSIQFWFLGLAGGLLVIAIDELRKLLGRGRLAC